MSNLKGNSKCTALHKPKQKDLRSKKLCVIRRAICYAYCANGCEMRDEAETTIKLMRYSCNGSPRDRRPLQEKMSQMYSNGTRTRATTWVSGHREEEQSSASKTGCRGDA